MGRSASQIAKAAGDFGTPRNCKRQAMFAHACKTSVSRMIVSLGLADDIVDAIVDEQGYNTPHAFSRLDKKGIEQLVSAIRKPCGMKRGTWNPKINVPLWSQELIMGACFALNHQRRCGEKYHPSLVSLNILEELRLQQEIEDTHNNKVAYDSCPIWDSKNCAASAVLITQHFRQICGIDSAPCTYLMRKHIVLSPSPSTSNDHAESFGDINDQAQSDHQVVQPVVEPGCSRSGASPEILYSQGSRRRCMMLP